ncbi:hypothetical protein M413DRAFT_440799 [Hebeloma cylindrosporum]|uniref:Protein BIG1 n=1 Tax=Hebeloma cylindrosporum TaxID=76867 RepID=A0A0C3CPJ8_HEBCY|nr:hypothetical protein M413DRAFT_440799 [Hebeloma cylindrosporum h7]
MASRFLVVAAVANAVLAYSNTAPVVAWSSSYSSALNSLPSQLDSTFHSISLLESILDAEDICNHDAVVIIAQPGLHASDLRTLSPTARISRSLSSSPSARQYPYLPAHPELDLTSIAGRVSSKCGSRLLQYSPGHADVTLEQDAKHVVYLGMPHLDESGRARKEAIANHERLLGIELEALASEFPDHLVIYTGSPLFPSAFSKRQAADIPDRPTLDISSQPLTFSASAAANTTLPSGGILKRYQILTSGLITILLVVFFIFVPVLLIGINALASIQNPVRTDVSKSFNAQERKNQ